MADQSVTRQDFLDLAQQINSRFDALEQRFDQKLGTLEQRFDQKLESLEQRFEGKLDAVEDRMRAYAKEVADHMESRIVGAFMGIAQSHELRMRNLELADDGVRQRLAALESRVLELERRAGTQQPPGGLTQ